LLGPVHPPKHPWASSAKAAFLVVPNHVYVWATEYMEQSSVAEYHGATN